MCEPQAFIVVVKAVIQYNTKIVLVRRRDDEYYYKGMWELPGGKIDKKDFSYRSTSGYNILTKALQREIFEETGLSVLLDELPITHFIAKPEKGGKYPGKAALIIFFQGKTESYNPVCGGELEDIELFDFIEILQINENNKIPASHYDAIKKSCVY